jgi:uncharacterized protein YuzE
MRIGFCRVSHRLIALSGLFVKGRYYQETNRVYIEITQEQSAESREVADGLNVDLDADGNVIGSNINNASHLGALLRDFIASGATIEGSGAGLGLARGQTRGDRPGDRAAAEVLTRQIEVRVAMPPCLIGMEACVGAHHLSRKLQA